MPLLHWRQLFLLSVQQGSSGPDDILPHKALPWKPWGWQRPISCHQVPIDFKLHIIAVYFIRVFLFRVPHHHEIFRSGYKGARLSHPHSQQFQYCLQTLTLWREIQNDMFKLWCLAEEDLLHCNNYYSLRDTGQGLNRVQSAPTIGKHMHEILHRSQKKLGSWIGSSVVHLGDHNVPNALTFIDKYTQVLRETFKNHFTESADYKTFHRTGAPDPEPHCGCDRVDTTVCFLIFCFRERTSLSHDQMLCVFYYSILNREHHLIMIKCYLCYFRTKCYLLY